jgi:hypothetical protein
MMSQRSALHAVLTLLSVGAGACADARDGSASWSAVTTELQGAALAVWGASDRDVYIGGGGVGAASTPGAVLHFDGADWRRLPLERDETVWWLWGASEGTDVWAVGERGLVARWDGTEFAMIESGTQATLFGVWGTSSDDVWIVGGKPGAGRTDDNDVVLHWDGSELSRDAAMPTKGAALLKVWGSGAHEVWVVGEGGTVWRRNADGWTDFTAEAGATKTLFGVHGCSSNEVYAVGSEGVFLFDGAWRADTLGGATGANGVVCGKETVLVVGGAGMKMRLARDEGAWSDEQLLPPAEWELHGAWISPTGALWAVGGNFLSPPEIGKRVGVIGYYGADAPPAPRFSRPPGDEKE